MPFTHRTVLLAATTTLLTSVASAQISVDPGTTVVMGTQPSGAAFADFDGDGDIDLATTVDGPDRVQVALNDGTGNFLPGPATFLGASSSPQDLTWGDFNNDGLMDVAVAVRDPFGAIVILQGLGGGSFVPTQTVAVGTRPRGLDAADFDGDGDVDLACVARDGNTAHVLTNSGGLFTNTTLAAGQEPRKAAFGDFDGDGDLDLAVTNHDSRTIQTWINTGGAFGAGQTIPTGGIFRPEGIDALDLDADGDDDLVVTLSDDVVPNVIGVYTASAGTIAAAGSYPTGGLNSGQVAMADLDCDGFIDAIVSNTDSGNVSVLPGAAGNTFGAAMIMAAGAGASEIAINDLDADGDLDFIVANGDGASVSVFRNAGDCEGGGGPDPLPCPQDLDADGSVDFDDLLSLLGAWGPCPTK